MNREKHIPGQPRIRWVAGMEEDSEAAVGIQQAYQLVVRPGGFGDSCERNLSGSPCYPQQALRRSVSDKVWYKTSTNKPTVDEVHVRIEKERESSGVEMVACAMSLMLLGDNGLLQVVWNLPEPG
jgi:hypothetical protein